ncbi:MAG: hypothetical protein ACRET7_00420 [Burkholderiales bacterium]
MKKAPKRSVKRPRSGANDMRPEYDFRGGIRGKYAERYRTGVNVVLLEPDVADEFPTARNVNRGLRELVRLRSKRRTA